MDCEGRIRPLVRNRRAQPCVYAFPVYVCAYALFERTLVICCCGIMESVFFLQRIPFHAHYSLQCAIVPCAPSSIFFGLLRATVHPLYIMNVLVMNDGLSYVHLTHV